MDKQAKTTVNYIPLSDRVLVREEPVETVSKGGIIIPDTAEKDPKAMGIVVAIGAGFKDNPMTVECGDKINYSKYAGSEIKVEGETYRIMRETDIFGIFPSKPVGLVAQSPVEDVVRPESSVNPITGEDITPDEFLEKQIGKSRKK